MAQRGLEARIDLVELEKLCAMQATDDEIGAFFGVSARTILRRKKVPRFAEVMERGRAKGRLSMRRMQMKLLEAGNATMGVWLGKQYLGQGDHGIPPYSGIIKVITMPKLPGVVQPGLTPLDHPNAVNAAAQLAAREGPGSTGDAVTIDVTCHGPEKG